MKEIRYIIDGILIVDRVDGKLVERSFRLPSGFGGGEFLDWKDRNKKKFRTYNEKNKR